MKQKKSQHILLLNLQFLDKWIKEVDKFETKYKCKVVYNLDLHEVKTSKTKSITEARAKEISIINETYKWK